MNRAYAVLQWKTADEDRRIIEGVATTPAPDRMNDVIDPEGVEFKLPLPLLYQHNSRQPIGHVLAAKVTKAGITVKAQVAAAGVAGFIDEAWNLIKAGLVRGLSIGFKSLEESYDRESGGFHFLRTEWIELSAVTIPANSEATILAVKSAALAAVSGNGECPVVRLAARGTIIRPGVTGAALRDNDVTTQEQIANFENKRAATAARMAAIMAKAGDEGRTLDEAETEEYDGLAREVKAVDDHLVRLRAHEKALITRGTAIAGETTQTAAAASATRGGHANGGASSVVTVRSNLPKGTAFSRYVMALASCRGNKFEAADMARRQWADSTPEVELLLKADTPPGTTTAPAWAGYLVPNATNVMGEFLELLRPATVIGRIPGLRRVPFNVTLPAQTAGGLYGWVGENVKKPVGALTFSQVSLRWAKVAGIIVLTKELVKFSNPSAEAIVRDDMVKGTAQFMDQQFVDPAVAEVANVSPASITNGITPVAPTGTTADAFRKDMGTLMGAFVTANNDPTGAVVLMSATQALNLSLMQNPLGQSEFPGIGVNGGTIMGLPAVVSETVGTKIILVNASDILLAEDGGVEIDVSEEASLIMSTTPDVPPDQALVSLWQNNLVGLRVDRFVTWKRAKTASVAFISPAAYVAG
jgi:HK97 family phage major capsid protein/HK97 family phage prohead protease